MTSACAFCGRPFNAQRRAAKFCGATCRQRAHRNPSVVPMTPRPPVPADTELLKVVRRQLHEAGVYDTWSGWMAEKAAEVMADPFCPASALVALSRELYALMKDLRGHEPTAAEIAEIRALRSGGAH